MKIPSIQIDTTLLPVERQFAEWAGHSRNTILEPERPGAFLAQGRLWDLGSASLAIIRLDPFTSTRPRDLVHAADANFIQVVSLRQGSVRMEADGSAQDCVAPDIFVRDYAMPSRAVSSAIDAIVLYLARDFLAELVGPVRMHGRLPPSPETKMLRACLEAVAGSLPDADAGSAADLSRVLRAATAAAVRRCVSPTLPAAGSEDRFRRAKAYIAAQPAGTVSVAHMAVALGMSRSALFEMFRPYRGVLAYDRLRRLRALYRALGDLGDRRNLQDLGAAHGFEDPSALARTFRRTFGCSMTSLREGRAGQADRPDAPGEHVRQIVGRLG